MVRTLSPVQSAWVSRAFSAEVPLISPWKWTESQQSAHKDAIGNIEASSPYFSAHKELWPPVFLCSFNSWREVESRQLRGRPNQPSSEVHDHSRRLPAKGALEGWLYVCFHGNNFKAGWNKLLESRRDNYSLMSFWNWDALKVEWF